MFWKYSSSPGEHMKNDRYIRTLRSYSFLNLLGITLLLLSSSGYSADAQEETQYVRFIEGTSQWQGELQTAIVSFENDAGVKLNLVAAVHLGEEEYYAALNEYFTTQDVVLYELVAEANQIPVQGAAGSTSLNWLHAAEPCQVPECRIPAQRDRLLTIEFSPRRPDAFAIRGVDGEQG